MAAGWRGRAGGGFRVASALLAMLAAVGRVSPRQATSLFAQPKREAKNLPHIQRPRPPRVAGQSGQPAITANTGVRQNSLRAKALRSNSCRKSEHEVWLSCGSQTASICCDRRRWLKGVEGHPEQPTANSQQPTANSQQPTANSQQPTANSLRELCDEPFGLAGCESGDVRFGQANQLVEQVQHCFGFALGQWWKW